MQKIRLRIPVIAAAALAVVGATRTDRTESADPNLTTITPANGEATVLVRNHNWLDVEVVAITEAGKRFRLGAVSRGLERTFGLPSVLVGGDSQFRLKVYSIDRQVGALLSTRYRQVVETNPISAGAGSEIVLFVQDPLGDSFIASAL